MLEDELNKKLEDLSIPEFYNFVMWCFPKEFPTEEELNSAIDRQIDIMNCDSVKELWELYCDVCKD